jgi:antitoxin CcdA
MRMKKVTENAPMRSAGHKPPIPKKSANLSIDSELLREAKALNISLSKTLEKRLGELVKEARGQRWLEENHQAITEYNRRIEQRGVFSRGVRRF